MKRTIYTFFTVLCALFVMVSCSKSEDNVGVVVEIIMEIVMGIMVVIIVKV